MLGQVERRKTLRKKRLAKNTLSSLIYQVTTIVCGFILPRFMLNYYGSEVNGIVNSIAQFLQIIAFLDLGVGAVVQSSLYKPLADNDAVQISRVMKSAGKFFQRLAKILVVYVAILICIYPFIANQNFGFAYTATLIVAMSVSSFAQYYFGVSNRMLLLADQRGYVQYNIQTITLVMNTVTCSFLIVCGASIHVVKLTTSLIYLLRPIGFKVYVDRHYKIDSKITYSVEPIKQKWNGVAQHVAAVVLDGTDSIVLTVFATLSDVSIYSVYHLVVYGVKQLFNSMTNGVQALMGELWAKQELLELKDFFGWVEWVIHTGTIFAFSCTGVLILPFVSIYTRGINDADYIQPLFAAVLVTANAAHCLCTPYHLMILAGGHYKQTQNNFVISAVMNIVLSIILVNSYGLIGVAIGTLAAMLYQTVWMAYYNSKNFIEWPFWLFLKQIAIDIITVILVVMCSNAVNMNVSTYMEWFICTIKVAICSLLIIAIINWIFYREKEKKLIGMIVKRICKSGKNNLCV